MRFYIRSILSGGSAVGAIIGAWGATQGIIAQLSIDSQFSAWINWRVPWYILVIGGLIIILFSSLRKASTIYKDETRRLENEVEATRRETANKFRALLRQSYHDSEEPLSLDYKIRVDRRSLADIYPTIIQNKKSRVSVAAGFLCVTNNSQDSVNMEVECKLISSNMPLFTRDRVDNIPWVEQRSIQRIRMINPHGSWDLLVVMFKMVDYFHMGFQFPSCLMSDNKRLGYRTESRISTYRIGKEIKESPYIDAELKIIAVSAINERRFIEKIATYHVQGNLHTTDLIITPIENIGGESLC